ncbi:AbrB/MazE/SpoVT family DNA-binding domain-containing protein [Candidatus Woesearchaeota archaeon]|nr:AbrB/MazE/SpoVT family DNA-binding domain-containing protein [Candidatus Woesearchaeota archaeon]
MTDVITVGEKGQIVIPKLIRDEFKIQKGTKLIISEDKDRIIIKPTKMDENTLMLLLSELSLKKAWDNKYDKQWDEVF